ncbi:hypothetical protein QBC43DRAFT_321804, partial [Cladorrhinum sp. PSN259]
MRSFFFLFFVVFFSFHGLLVWSLGWSKQAGFDGWVSIGYFFSSFIFLSFL